MSLPLDSALALFISKLCLCPSPGSETPLGGLSIPVLYPAQFSPSPGGTMGVFGTPGTSRCRTFVTSWDAGGTGFVLPPICFSCRGRSQYLFCRLLHAPACIPASSFSTCKHQGWLCWPRSLPLLPPFYGWKFNRAGRMLALDSSAPPGAETKPHHRALLQPRDAENKGK